MMAKQPGERITIPYLGNISTPQETPYGLGAREIAKAFEGSPLLTVDMTF